MFYCIVILPAIYRASVDGATNHLYNKPDRDKYIPNIITGDFDSVNTDVLQYYKTKVNVILV